MDDHDRQVKEAINHITKEMASEIYIDTDSIQKQARFEWDHSYEGFLHRKKIKEVINTITKEIPVVKINKSISLEEQRYNLDRQRAEIKIMELRYEVLEAFQDTHQGIKPGGIIRELLEAEEELLELKNCYYTMVNEYLDAVNGGLK